MDSFSRVGGILMPVLSKQGPFVFLILFSTTAVLLLLRTVLSRGTNERPESCLEKPKLDSSVVVVPTINPLEEFRWENEQQHKIRAFKPIYHITMAVRSDTPSELITIDCGYLNRLRLRRELLQSENDTVHGCTSLSYDKSMFFNLVTGENHPTTPPSDPKAALKILGTTVEEDLFLLKNTPDGHQCVAFVCCFPSGWNPSSKLGAHMTKIHTTVPSYEKIGPSIERFFSRLQVGKGVKRSNWTVQTHDKLFNVKGNHIRPGEEAEEEDIEVDKVNIRARRTANFDANAQYSSCALSFKTYLYPIQEIKAEGLGTEFADAIEGLQKGNAPGMWRYKGAIRWGKRCVSTFEHKALF
ncbi:unnamed protein product [Clonostachys rosea f. rosea IK726]|uniref:Uncharacterized protein n=1 Tax=Clonostachys rosea f. rosea IK726 TaxID=1349383 RepID=A0ACA9UCS3_BIOOC|nr:unnamed protein product [Clonostachys rosea f. rosea IK726]